MAKYNPSSQTILIAPLSDSLISSTLSDSLNCEWHRTLMSFYSDYPDAKVRLYEVGIVKNDKIICIEKVYAGVDAEDEILSTCVNDFRYESNDGIPSEHILIAVRRLSLSKNTLNTEENIAKIAREIGGETKKNDKLIRDALQGDILALEKLLINQKNILTERYSRSNKRA